MLRITFERRCIADEQGNRQPVSMQAPKPRPSTMASKSGRFRNHGHLPWRGLVTALNNSRSKWSQIENKDGYSKCPDCNQTNAKQLPLRATPTYQRSIESRSI